MLSDPADVNVLPSDLLLKRVSFTYDEVLDIHSRQGKQNKQDVSGSYRINQLKCKPFFYQRQELSSGIVVSGKK